MKPGTATQMLEHGRCCPLVALLSRVGLLEQGLLCGELRTGAGESRPLSLRGVRVRKCRVDDLESLFALRRRVGESANLVQTHA